MKDDRERLRQVCVLALQGLDDLRAALLRLGYIVDEKPDHSPEVERILSRMRSKEITTE